MHLFKYDARSFVLFVLVGFDRLWLVWAISGTVLPLSKETSRGCGADPWHHALTTAKLKDAV